MRLICPGRLIDKNTQATILVFMDDNEYNTFMNRLITTPVRASGIRMISLHSGNMEAAPLQTMVLDIINGLDEVSNNNISNESKI
jgi:hypothetical protein